MDGVTSEEDVTVRCRAFSTARLSLFLPLIDSGPGISNRDSLAEALGDLPEKQ